MNPESKTSLLKAFVPMMAEHRSDPDVGKVLEWICKDDEFFLQPYSRNPNKKMIYTGSLAVATMSGYKVIRAMEKVAAIVYPTHKPPSVDRMVLCLLLLMGGRWVEHPTVSVSISNALLLANRMEIKLSDSEVQAITQSTDEFTLEWWIMSQVIQAIEVENMK